MNIALIFPRYKYQSGDAPLGILYIATYLRKNGYDVDVYDTTFHKNKSELLGMLASKNYDFVGFSLMTTMLRDSLQIAAYIKSCNPKTKIVFGGPHPTVMAEETLKHKDVDAVVIGEGEEAWLEVAKKASFDGVGGVWYKDCSAIIRNSPRDTFLELDHLPFPDQRLVDLNRYLRNWWQLDSVGKKLRGVNIINSRGCPYNCSFCQPTLRKIFGPRIRFRSPANVVEELKFWKKEIGIDAFMFQDDTLIFNKEWVREFCCMLKKARLQLVWGCNARANLVEYELFFLMRSAGLRKVFMGIESGSQRVLDEVYQKGISLGQVRQSVSILKKLGLKIQGYFMMGAPTETVEDVSDTIRLASELSIDEATFSITTPLPHTYLYEKTRHMICTDVGNFDYYKNPVLSGAEVIPRRVLRRLKQQALLRFYLSPKRLKGTLAGFANPASMHKSLIKLQRF
ncbi:MAG: radical SAM protein [Candidatus Woesearchaeota archaeon]